MNKVISSVALAAVFGLACAGVANAAEATGSVNVRSGPGTSYAVLDTLYAGENVDVEECSTNGWCLITHSGPDGWVSARYLSDEGDADRDDDRPVVRSSPSVSLSFSFGRGNGYSMGGPRGNSRDVVCLVTFQNASQVAGGADADVRRAQIMTRAQAERLDRPNDRRGIFDYGTNQQTRSTCDYLDNLN